MDVIRLNDILRFSEEQISRTKIRLNKNNGVENPIDVFKRDPAKLLDWNYWNSKKYKENQISIGLVNMGNRQYLLFTIGVIKKVNNIDGQGVAVEYDTLSEYEQLFGRLVVNYHNKSQQLFRNAKSIMDELIVAEILPSVYSGFDFPGYDNVCLSFKELETIVNGNFPSFRNALSNQKAVYLITDKATGKLYVGSATANDGMLLSRWSSYVQNGHGGNIELKIIVNKKGFEYIKENFQYTILENYNAKVDDEYIKARERYWKKVLCTLKYGYNKNM